MYKFAQLVLLPVALAAAGLEAQAPPSQTQNVMPLAQVERLDLQRMDTQALVARYRAPTGALPFKSARIAEPILVSATPSSYGTWEQLEDGTDLWRLRVRSRTALNLSVAFEPFDLPASARLWIYAPDGSTAWGPFTAADRSARGRFYSPLVLSSELVIELHVAAAERSQVQITLSRVHHGFVSLTRDLRVLSPKALVSGSCNNDVVCPEGDPWRDQIRATARYTIKGIILCSGQLVNNTAQDGRPLFLSAYHCRVTPANDDTTVFYWNYQSPTCGLRGGGSLADVQMGATYLAGEHDSDFLLIELAQVPSPDFDVFYAGWDVRGVAAQSSTTIHHPKGDVKSISFNDDPLTVAGFYAGTSSTHWEVDNWEDGTTEPGSSGACLYDDASGQCLGVLTGGLASCTVISLDRFARLSVGWEVGDDPSTRLRDWLDPLGTGVQRLDGRDRLSAVEVPASSRGSLFLFAAVLCCAGWLRMRRS